MHRQYNFTLPRTQQSDRFCETELSLNLRLVYSAVPILAFLGVDIDFVVPEIFYHLEEISGKKSILNFHILLNM